jgi:hypothetical protein
VWEGVHSLQVQTGKTSLRREGSKECRWVPGREHPRRKEAGAYSERGWVLRVGGEE